MGQLNLFDNSESTNEEFGFVYAAIREIAHSHSVLTSDDVWKRLEAKGVNQYGFEHNTIGTAMMQAGKSGLIKKTPTVQQSTRPSANGRIIRVWASAVRGA